MQPTMRSVSALCVLLAFVLTSRAIAQEAPYGACVLPSGQWCWPQQPGNFGEVCICVTPIGNHFGTIN